MTGPPQLQAKRRGDAAALRLGSGQARRRGDGSAIRFPGAKPFDVVGFGFNTSDHLCVVARPPGFDSKQRLSAYTQQPGGQVPTALVALQRWGLRTAYVGPFGDDDGGRAQRASLAAEGIDLRGTRVRAGIGSHTSIILVDAVSGERTVLWQRPDGLGLQADELDRKQLTAGRVLLMDADDEETALQAAAWAKAEDVVVVLDVDRPGPRIRELLALTDVLVAAWEFAARLTGATEVRPALQQMLRLGPTLAAVTLGRGGALAAERGQLHYVPAFAVPVADTTSAGDLFHAGCIYGLLQGWSVPHAFRFAAAAAALECTRLGGRAAIPSLEQVRSLVARRS